MIDILISQLLVLLVEWGYLGVFISSMGFFPSEIIIALLASTQHANIWTLALVSAFGGLIGSYLAYLLGYIFTEEAVYRWLDSNGKILRIDKKKVERNKKKMLKRSFLYVFLTRLVPWLRIVASMAAGFIKVNFFSYSIAVFTGGFLYAIVVAYLGSKAESDIESIKRYIGIMDKWIILITLVLIIIAIGHKQKKKISRLIVSSVERLS